MKYFIILFSTVILAQCRPQQQQDVPINQISSVQKLRKVTLLPYYGGAKGQSLQITESDDGRITTAIIKTPPKVDNTAEEEAINASELENPPLPSKLDEFGNNIKNIHSTALKIIALQEKVKKNGRLSESEEAIYKKNMDSLSMSAQNLAMIQEQAAAPFEFENREGLSAWLDRKKITSSGSKKKEEEDKNKEDQKRKEEEDKKKQEQEGGGEEAVNEPDDSVSINLPPEDASVAEAKPVGLAIAGDGGVAASKPIATAVVGPGGLAIARPVGTAIAGVSPDQALVPIYAEGYISGSKPSRNSVTKTDKTSEYLNRIISKYHQN